MSIFRLFKSTSTDKNDELSTDQEAITEAKEKSINELNKTSEVTIQSKITKPNKENIFRRLKHGLKKTRAKFGSSITDLLLGKKIIDEDLIEDIETQLLLADVGVEATEEIMETVRTKVERNELQTMEALTDLLKSKLNSILTPCSKTLKIDTSRKPYVILMVGINGAGKTTTIGKLAKKLQNDGKSVMLAAGDTFRAAATEQLQAWGDRNDITVVSQQTGADSASVIYDSIQAAKSRKIDVLIADTAGRLHTQNNLMEELKKIVRVIKKIDATAPHEVMLILDASTGQNAISQAASFKEAVSVSGITITKMDGTAKGGVIFAIAKKTQLPIRFIGIGESIDDLREFDANDFVNALFADETDSI